MNIANQLQSQSIASLARTYDELPYTSDVFNIAQPERLYTIAKMKGFNPPKLQNAKVLEIGCSFGGNLLPFAIQFPKAQVVGVDLSERQIAIGRQMFQSVGIENVELIAGDISQIELGQEFDYIICHGVFSWVPEDVRQAIFRTIKNHLSAKGVAYISYNTYPGWKTKDVIKDLMKFGSDPEDTPLNRYNQAMSILSFTKDFQEKHNSDFVKNPWLNKILEYKNISYITHEYLEKFNESFYFKEFLQMAAKHGLSYVADSSEPGNLMPLNGMSMQFDEICEQFNHHLYDIEQYLDFIFNKAFRCSILTHQANAQEANFVEHIGRSQQCFNFPDLFFTAFTEKVSKQENGTQVDYWQVNYSITYPCNEFTDGIFSYFQQNHHDLISVKEAIEHFKTLPNYHEDTINNILLYIIHSYQTYITYQGKKFQKLGRKPKLNKKYVNFIRFIAANPNISRPFNEFYQIVLEPNPLTFYLMPHIDGNNSTKDLVKILRQALIEDELRFLDEQGETVDPKDVSDNKLKVCIKEVIDNLQPLGWFNHYD